MTSLEKVRKWQEIFRDNSDPTNIDKGIIAFSRLLFPDTIKDYYGVSPIHIHIYRELLQLFHPERDMLQKRQLNLIVARDFSKSTIVNLIFVTYLVCYNGKTIIIADWDKNEEILLSTKGIEVEIDESLVILASETARGAEQWVSRVRAELAGNAVLKSVFGKMKPQSLRDEEGKWTASAFRTVKTRDYGNKELNELYSGKPLTVLGVGAGQQIRGKNVYGRPTTFIVDDVYSQRNTITESSRQTIRYWFDAESKNTIDKNTGKIVCIGTVVHEDTIVIDNEKSRFWTTIKYPAMDKDLFETVIKEHCKPVYQPHRLFVFPDAGKCKELEKQGYVTNWPERLTLEMLLTKYAEAWEGREEGKTLSMFWQELFHITLSEEEKIIRRDMMQDLDFDLITQKGITFVKIKREEGKYEYRNVETVIAIDAASSYNEYSDNTAITWVGKDYYARLYVIKNISGKFGFWDEFYTIEDSLTNKLCTDTSKIKRIGSADEVFRWLDGTNFKPKIVIETNNAGAELFKQFHRKMTLYGMRFSLIEYVSHINKYRRILDTLSPYYQSKAVYHNLNDNQELLKNELEYLGKTVHDDNADSFATAVMHLKKPYQIIEYVPDLKSEKLIASIKERARKPYNFLKTNPTNLNRHKPNWRTKI